MRLQMQRLQMQRRHSYRGWGPRGCVYGRFSHRWQKQKEREGSSAHCLKLTTEMWLHWTFSSFSDTYQISVCYSKDETDRFKFRGNKPKNSSRPQFYELLAEVAQPLRNDFPQL
jgi:hypothetical protein